LQEEETMTKPTNEEQWTDDLPHAIEQFEQFAKEHDDCVHRGRDQVQKGWHLLMAKRYRRAISALRAESEAVEAKWTGSGISLEDTQGAIEFMKGILKLVPMEASDRFTPANVIDTRNRGFVCLAIATLQDRAAALLAAKGANDGKR
jgi:hypothetical protein